MKTPLHCSMLFALLFAVPVYGQNALLYQSMIQFRAEVLSFLNVGVFITAVISFKQFFFPGDNNTLPFQVFNIVFVGLFYGLGLPFLIANRAYYEGYETLMPMEVLGKFFLSATFSSVAQWVIIASVIVNVLYIIRFRKDYYEAGIASSTQEKPEVASLPQVQPPVVHVSDALTEEKQHDTEQKSDMAATNEEENITDSNNDDSPYKTIANNEFVATVQVPAS